MVKVKYVVIYGPRDIRVEDVEVPKIGSDDVLIQVKACGICGSDIHRYVGDRFGRRLAPYPLNSGHEYGGCVTRVGKNVKRIKVNDRVTLGLNWVRDGMGAFAEYLRIPHADERPIKKVPDEISFEETAQIEPLIVALNGFWGVKPAVTDTVLILGAGPIGLCLLERCRSEGIEDVIVSEISPRRLDVAKQLGAIGVNAAKENVEERVQALTDGKGVDVTFECAGATITTKQALSFTKQRGRIMLIAHYSKSAEIDPEEIVSKNLLVYGYGNYAYEPFDEAIKLILEDKIQLKSFISHEFPLERAKEAFEVALQPNISVKVLIKPMMSQQ
jgi:2-desacetyl-2-hydroxyethyl bacteriochlorophyllide A dehydrogenase